MYSFVGNVDIVNGNLKLILGLIWSLIVRYQIGKSKFPPRKLMLSWLKVTSYTILLTISLRAFLFYVHVDLTCEFIFFSYLTMSQSIVIVVTLGKFV